MMQRLRDRLLDLLDELSAKRIRRRRNVCSTPPKAMKGNMRSVLVVTPPDPRFVQAVFVLRDDYFKEPGLSREELLREARSAADIYCGSVAPPRADGLHLPVVFTALVSSALTLLILRIGGLL